MGKVNVCLKRSYIVVISLIAVISLVVLVFTPLLFSDRELKEEGLRTAVMLSFYFIILIFVLTIFGAIGVWKEKKWALKVYAVGVILESIVLLVVIILLFVGLASHSELVEELKKEYLRLLPLTESSKELLDDLQTDLSLSILMFFFDFHLSYQDWKSNIPKSCLCAKESTNPCVEILGGSWEENQTVMIYEQGCLTYLVEILMHGFKIFGGMLLGFLLLWMLSLVLCRAILCQLNRNRDTPVVN